MAKKKTPFDAPIPGMSLTAEPKSRPWRRPYQVSTVDDAVMLYAPMFESPEFGVLLAEQAENGIPLSSIANIFITASVMEGKHSIDVGILIAPILIELMISIVEELGVKPVIGTEPELYAEDNQDNTLELIRRAMKQAKSETGTTKEQTMEEPAIEESMQEQPPARGLMARRSAM